MSDTPTQTVASDTQFERAVAQFLVLREKGATPPIEQYVQGYPELAEQLRAFFADQALFDRLAPDLAPTPEMRAGEPEPRPTEAVGGHGGLKPGTRMGAYV